MFIYFNFFFADHSETKPIVSFIGDICEPETIEKAFQGVDCVFHCAAFINFQFPSDLTELERVNVNGKLSSEASIKRFNFFSNFRKGNVMSKFNLILK